MPKPRTDGSKKQYVPPRLIVHGTVRKLTQNVGIHGAADGGSGFRIRTQT